MHTWHSTKHWDLYDYGFKKKNWLYRVSLRAYSFSVRIPEHFIGKAFNIPVSHKNVL